MSNKKFMETSIPENFSVALNDEKSLTVGATHADKIATVLFAAVGNCMRMIKHKDKPAVFEFTELNGDLIGAAVVSWSVPEDGDETSGHWLYDWGFEKDIIPEDALVVKITDSQTHPYFVSEAGTRFRMGYETDSALVELMNGILRHIKKYLVDNASEKEETVVELDGVFIARSSVENGEVVCSIEPVGEMKQLIKDDKRDEI